MKSKGKEINRATTKKALLLEAKHMAVTAAGKKKAKQSKKNPNGGHGNKCNRSYNKETILHTLCSPFSLPKDLRELEHSYGERLGAVLVQPWRRLLGDFTVAFQDRD